MITAKITFPAVWRTYHALLSPPPLAGPGTYAERDRARRGRLLGTLIGAVLLLAVLQLLAGILRPDRGTAIIGTFCLAQTLCAWLNRRGRLREASWLFLVGLSVINVGFMVEAPVVLPPPGLIACGFTVVLSGFLLSRKAPFAFAAWNILVLAAHVFQHAHALAAMPDYAGNPYPLIVGPAAVTLTVLAAITSLGAGSLEDALARADEADVLEHRVAERTADLADSQERLRFALEGADLGVWSHDIVSGRMTLSDECCRLHGLEPGRPLSRYEDLLAMVHEDDRSAFQEKALAAARAGAGYQHEFRILRPDGLRWLAAMGRFTCEEGTGRLLRVDGAVMDVTERKTLEAERERLLAEALERADRDPLTGLLNHRAFHRRLDEEADRALRAGQTLCVAMLDLDNFKFFNDAYGHLAGDDVLRQVACALTGVCRSYDTLARFGGDEFALLLPGLSAPEAAALTERLQAGLDALGYRPPGHDVAIPLNLSVGLAALPGDAPTRTEALALADERLYRSKTGGDDRAEAGRLRDGLVQHRDGFPMLDALVAAVDNKDRYTCRHSEDVMLYSLQIAKALGIGEAERHTIAVAALLHDVGKIGVPDAILRKPGGLTEEEAASIRQHPTMGAVIVGAVPGFEATLDAVRHHHERWDGGGYPSGLAGAETPLSARLMAVADAYSAMTTDRPYRKGMPEGRALTILEAGAGTQWDPACVSAFLSTRRTAEPFSPKP